MQASTTTASPFDDTDDTEYQLSQLVPMFDLVRLHPGLLTENRIRHLSKQRATNGLLESGALVMVGSQLYAHQARFTRWLLDHQRSGGK